MPRPTRARTSLPGHSRAAKVKAAEDDLPPYNPDDSIMLDMTASAAQPSTALGPEPTAAAEEDESRPVAKQKKADKAYAKREALLAKITAGATPYSKSHARRLRRAARPENNLVASLNSVQSALQEMAPQVAAAADEEADSADESAEDEAEQKAVPGQVGKGAGQGGKGQEKLTAKKRSRVLNAEVQRMPAVMANPAFAAKPWETIRLHTLNTMEKAKTNPKPQPAGAGNKKRK